MRILSCEQKTWMRDNKITSIEWNTKHNGTQFHISKQKQKFKFPRLSWLSPNDVLFLWTTAASLSRLSLTFQDTYPSTTTTDGHTTECRFLALVRRIENLVITVSSVLWNELRRATPPQPHLHWSERTHTVERWGLKQCVTEARSRRYAV
jgi:hypothetical protein